MHYYAPIPSEEVPEETRSAATGMLKAASEDLRLEGIALRWFREETEEEAAEREAWRDEELGPLAGRDDLPPAAIEAAYETAQILALWQREEQTGDMVRLKNDGPLYGCFFRHRPREVWIRYDLSPDEAAHVAAHELRHLWWFLHYDVTKMRGYDPKNPPDLRQYWEGSAEAYARLAVAALPWRPT